MCLGFFSSSADPRDLHSFPTRRSSDLRILPRIACRKNAQSATSSARNTNATRTSWSDRRVKPISMRPDTNGSIRKRSEEHTSELQSRGHLVCRLLLEKKKKKNNQLKTK